MPIVTIFDPLDQRNIPFMSHKFFFAAITVAILAGCGNEPAPDLDPAEKAKQIAASSIIVDTHVDVPYRLESRPADVTMATEDGDFEERPAPKQLPGDAVTVLLPYGSLFFAAARDFEEE